MHLNKNIEKSVEAWMFRALIGPGYVVDGLVQTFSLGFVTAGVAVYFARKLAVARFKTFGVKQ